MKWIKKWLPRIYMIGAIFWFLIYWIAKYTTIEVVQESQMKISIIPLLLIIISTAIIVYGGFFILLVSWWEKIKDDKFSIYTFLPIYILLIGTMVISWLGTNKLKLLIEVSANQFIQDLVGYQVSMRNSLLILISGIFLGVIGYVFEEKP
jgi:hypothetical protein